MNSDLSNYKIGPKYLSHFKTAIKKAVENETIIQIRGYGAAGSFKLSKAVQKQFELETEKREEEEAKIEEIEEQNYVEIKEEVIDPDEVIQEIPINQHDVKVHDVKALYKNSLIFGTHYLEGARLGIVVTRAHIIQ